MNHSDCLCPTCRTRTRGEGGVCEHCGTPLPGPESLIIGADPGCDICLDLPSISGRHCRLTWSADGWMLQDLGSRNGTYVDGSPITKPVLIHPSQFITLGTQTLFPWANIPGHEAGIADSPDHTISIGRNPKSDLVLDQLMVSWDHARMYQRGKQWWIEDLGSANGLAIQHPSNRIKAAPLNEGDQVFFGSCAVDGSLLLARAKALKPARSLPNAQGMAQPAAPPEPKTIPLQKVKTRHTLIAIGMGVAILAGLGVWNASARLGRSQAAMSYPMGSAAENLTPAMVFEKVKDSVVIVKVFDEQGEMLGFGSGVKLPSGRIVTNFHVVKDGWCFQVGSGHSYFAATVRARDADKDMCLLEAPGLNVPPVSVGSTSGLKVGDRVYAVGSPQGLELSLSEGLVSQLRGGPPPYIQTTAAISPGSSGGGLFDSRGSLVGITSFFFKGGENLNFAIPADWTMDLEASVVP